MQYLKKEVHHRKYRDFKETSISIFKFIEGWYNWNRIHSSINYMTPDEFEQKALLDH